VLYPIELRAQLTLVFLFSMLVAPALCEATVRAHLS